MIISHEHGFVFVKTAKTAGTSIEVLLSEQCGPDDVVTPFVGEESGHQPRNYRGLFDPRPETLERLRGHLGGHHETLRDLVRRNRFEHHTPAWQIRLRAPRAWEEYLTFCVVRNPWDVVLSGLDYHRAVTGEVMPLDAYLSRLATRAAKHRRGIGRYPFNLWNYTHPVSGRLLVDRVVRYERLDEDLARVLHPLGLRFDRLRRRAKGGVRRPRDLTISEFDRIAELCAVEVELHGYTAEDFSGTVV